MLIIKEVTGETESIYKVREVRAYVTEDTPAQTFVSKVRWWPLDIGTEDITAGGSVVSVFADGQIIATYVVTGK